MNLLDDTTNQHSKFRTKFGFKQMMNHDEIITMMMIIMMIMMMIIITLNLKRQ